MSGPVVQVEALSYRYPTRSDFALIEVDLAVERGEFVAFIGQNGSGKTTLIKHFNGLLKPTSGRVWVEGRETTPLRTSELARSVGYVFQNPDHQIFAETVRDEIAFGPRNLGFPLERIQAVTRQVLEDVGLTGSEEAMPFQLSRGQRQRLAVASVLAMEPRILIVDEPTTGQDWKESVELMELVKRLNGKGHTCLVTTHNMNLVSLYARRVVVMSQGRILLDGPTQDVFREMDQLVRAGIKPPEVYELARTLLPGIRLERPLTPQDLADLLIERVLATPARQEKGGPGL
jgi:energy-coupling factor transport system ATP-binding protein